jgi:sulfide:quinone oxidoreductase
MPKVLILGGGVSGHTAALHAKRLLGNKAEVTVVTPNSKWNWIPSNIWVGVGKMTASQVVFPLAPVYKRKKIEYLQAKAVAIRPFGDDSSEQGAVDIEFTGQNRIGENARVRYDYLINATGPQLRFDLTKGLGPTGNSVSVCTYQHAEDANKALQAVIAKLKAGQPQTLVIGMGHGTCTCEGAAFEYVFNVDHELRAANVRDLAEVIYLSNEHELGDFGVGGMEFEGGLNSETWMTGIFAKHNIKVILQAHVTEVLPNEVEYETISGETLTQKFDFAMLLPPFRGVTMAAFDRVGTDITADMFAANGFMKVDADYTVKDFEEWRGIDWPKTYEAPLFPNVFGVGIAFAPPHAISKPYKTPTGTLVAPAPPRTGMPAGVQGRVAAETIALRIKSGDAKYPAKTASMADMGAACIASIGNGLFDGSAATITMAPIVPDKTVYPTGRDLTVTSGEIGLAGHWIKRMLHTLFIYKAKALPGWTNIPE